MMRGKYFLSILFVVVGLLAFASLACWFWTGEQEAKLPYSTGYDPTDKVQEEWRKRNLTNTVAVPTQRNDLPLLDR